jgi:hypothetical protein
MSHLVYRIVACVADSLLHWGRVVIFICALTTFPVRWYLSTAETTISTANLRTLVGHFFMKLCPVSGVIWADDADHTTFLSDGASVLSFHRHL